MVLNLFSGRDLGPLSLELPIVVKKHSVFSDQSYHRLGDYSKKEDVMDSEGADLAAWTDSFLLDEVTRYSDALCVSFLFQVSLKH